MTKSEILKSIASMSPEMQAELLIGVGRILEPNAERIGIWLSDNQTNIENLYGFFTDMSISYDRQFKGAYDVDFIDESLTDLKIGYSFDKGIVTAWTTRGVELPGYLLPEVERRINRTYRRVEVA